MIDTLITLCWQAILLILYFNIGRMHNRNKASDKILKSYEESLKNQRELLEELTITKMQQRILNKKIDDLMEHVND